MGFRQPEPSAEQTEIEEFIFSLTDKQRAILMTMLQEEKTSGIHDALAFFEGEEYTISDPSGRSFTGSPYAALHLDYVARLEGGEPWPKWPQRVLSDLLTKLSSKGPRKEELRMHEAFYREFIDGLVEVSDSIQAGRIESGFRQPEPSAEQKEIEEFVFSLTDKQKAILANMLRHEKTGGIHDALAFFEGEEYTISDPSGRSFTGSPYADLHFDYVARLEGDPWPKG